MKNAKYLNIMGVIESGAIIYWIAMNNMGLVNPLNIGLIYLIILVLNFYIIDNITSSDLKKATSSIYGYISGAITLFLYFNMIFVGVAFWWIYIIYVLLLVAYILTRRQDLLDL
jgi:phosphatidylserine synthase